MQRTMEPRVVPGGGEPAMLASRERCLLPVLGLGAVDDGLP